MNNAPNNQQQQQQNQANNQQQIVVAPPLLTPLRYPRRDFESLTLRIHVKCQ